MTLDVIEPSFVRLHATIVPYVIFQVTMTEGVEPGWLGGVLHGQTGWFPEAYTEPLDTREAEVASESLVRTQLE